MNKFECIVILNIKNIEEKDRILNELKRVMENVEEIEEWGKKKLAYPIQKQNEGYYILINFSQKDSEIPNIEQTIKSCDEIIKYIIVKKN